MKKETTTGKQGNTRSNTRNNVNNPNQGTMTRQRRNPGTMTQNQGENQESLLETLFVDLLNDIYAAEKTLVESLTTMHQQAFTEDLQDAFEDHMYITQKQVTRLEKIFQMIGLQPEEKTCVGMEGLVEEANELVEKTMEGTMTRDAALIIAQQKIEHYEIAAYGSLVQLALTLGHDHIAYLLEKTLWEEENTDALLTEIAECEVNPFADTEENEMVNQHEMEEA